VNHLVPQDIIVQNQGARLRAQDSPGRQNIQNSSRNNKEGS